MAFIKKQKLVEEVKEEPVVETLTESVEDNLQSALLEVVSDELTYVAKLNRMIELAEQAEKNDLVDALKKSRAKIKRDIVEVYSKGKKILGLETEDEDTKEEVTEAVDPSKVYSGKDIYEIVTNYTIDFIDTDRDTYEALDSLARQFDDDEDYTAEQIDAELARYEIDPTTLESIENEISALPDAKQSRIEEFKSDLDTDVSTLETLIDTEKFYTYAAIDRIRNIINELKEFNYDGAPNTCWGPQNFNKDKRQHFIS